MGQRQKRPPALLSWELPWEQPPERLTLRVELHRHEIGCVCHQKMGDLQRGQQQSAGAGGRQLGGKGLQAQGGAQLRGGRSVKEQLVKGRACWNGCKNGP